MDRECRTIFRAEYGVYEGGPQNPWNLFIKNCIYSYMFKFQSPSKHSSFDAIHLLRCFFPPLLKTVFELVDFDAFYCFHCFLFHLFHIGKTFFFEDFFFHPGKQKSHSGRERVNREGGTRGSCHFWSKTAKHSAWCAQGCS